MPIATLTSWQVPPAEIHLEKQSLHLWRFPLSNGAQQRFLSHDEQQRAQRLRVPHKARAFVAARSQLRQILGHYLGIAPGDLEFQYNENGKPFLAGQPLHFNLSHSGDWGVCAVTHLAGIGVDLELLKPDLDYAPLARRFFSEHENQWLQSSPAQRRRRNFYRLWTRKEAWLKGKGGGFSELNLELAAAHIASVSAIAKGWQVMNLPIARGYVGALAVAGEVEKVERWHMGGLFSV